MAMICTENVVFLRTKQTYACKNVNIDLQQSTNWKNGTYRETSCPSLGWDNDRVVRLVPERTLQVNELGESLVPLLQEVDAIHK